MVLHMCTSGLHSLAPSDDRGYVAHKLGPRRSVGGYSARNGALRGVPDIEWMADSPRAPFVD